VRQIGMLLHMTARSQMCWFSMQTSICMSQYVPDSVCATAAPEHNGAEIYGMLQYDAL